MAEAIRAVGEIVALLVVFGGGLLFSILLLVAGLGPSNKDPNE